MYTLERLSQDREVKFGICERHAYKLWEGDMYVEVIYGKDYGLYSCVMVIYHCEGNVSSLCIQDVDQQEQDIWLVEQLNKLAQGIACTCEIIPA